MEKDKENDITESPGTTPSPVLSSNLSKLHFFPLQDCPPKFLGHCVEFTELFFPGDVKTMNELILTGITESFRMSLVGNRRKLRLAPESDTADVEYDIPIALLSSDVEWPNSAVSKFQQEWAKDGQPRDLFSENFVISCLRENVVKNLNLFKLYPTRFENYDANDIFFGRRKWSDLTLLPKPAKRGRLRQLKSSNHKDPKITEADEKAADLSPPSAVKRPRSGEKKLLLLPVPPIFAAPSTSTWSSAFTKQPGTELNGTQLKVPALTITRRIINPVMPSKETTTVVEFP